MLNPYVNEKIYYYKNVIKNPQEIVDSLNDLKESWNFYPTKENNVQPYQKNSYEFTEYKKVKIDSINNILDECINDYEIKNNIKIKKFTDMVIHKSYPGKFLGPHTDSHGDNNSPLITIIIDFNDNYVGGELIFDKQNLTLKSIAGSILIYPSIEPYSHVPTLITSGSKITGLMFGYL